MHAASAFALIRWDRLGQDARGSCILLTWKILQPLRRTPTDLLRSQFLRLSFCAVVSFPFFPVQAQTPAQQPAQKPAAKPSAQTPEAQPGVAGPQQTKHYPILVVAHGNEPSWSLRLGMKGPERLDRAGYPPIVLEPSDVVRDDSGTFWTYHAKDAATGALLSVKLVREPCSDGMSETQYTFKVIVEHAQIGTLNGCGQSTPDKFPEFRKKNQPLDPDENANAEDKDKDKDKKGVLDPITNFKSPVAVAYLNATGRVVLSRGEIKKIVGPSGLELALSHDGRKLLYTRSNSTNGLERSIVLYDADTGQTKDLVSGDVHQAFWSPDDSRIAFLKFDGQQWHVWTMPSAEPDKATQLSPLNVTVLQGWVFTERDFSDERGECLLDWRRWKRATDRTTEGNLRRTVSDHEQRHDPGESGKCGSAAGFCLLPSYAHGSAGGLDGAGVDVFSVRSTVETSRSSGSDGRLYARALNGRATGCRFSSREECPVKGRSLRIESFGMVRE